MPEDFFPTSGFIGLAKPSFDHLSQSLQSHGEGLVLLRAAGEERVVQGGDCVFLCIFGGGLVEAIGRKEVIVCQFNVYSLQIKHPCSHSTKQSKVTINNSTYTMRW